MHRASYNLGEVVHLVKDVLGDRQNKHREETLGRFHQYMRKAMDPEVFSDLVNQLVGHPLKPEELISLQNAVDNSPEDGITLAAFLNFSKNLERQPRGWF